MDRPAGRRRLGIAIAVSLGAHLALLAALDFAPPSGALGPTPKSAPRPISVSLSAPQSAPARPARQPVEPREASPSVAVEPQPRSPQPPAGIAEPEAGPPPDPAGKAVFVGRNAYDLARDVAAFARVDDYDPGNQSGRVRRLYAGSDATPEFAYYLEAWRREVERIGNLNYPGEAKSRRLEGSLVLLVTIAADGALKDVRVVKTSGHSVLDEAALHIVRLAAPYAPFSPRMRRTTDVLEIERTWHFRNSRYSS